MDTRYCDTILCNEFDHEGIRGNNIPPDIYADVSKHLTLADEVTTPPSTDVLIRDALVASAQVLIL